MKTIKIKAISAVIFLGATVLYGAGNESLYMGNVGRINPATAQVLTGEVQVSGIQSPTKLTLDLVLPNGSLYPVNNILYQNYHLLWRGDRLGLVILNKSDWVQHLYRHLRKNIRAIKIPLQIDNLFFSCIQFRNAFSRTLTCSNKGTPVELFKNAIRKKKWVCRTSLLNLAS